MLGSLVILWGYVCCASALSPASTSTFFSQSVFLPHSLSDCDSLNMLGPRSDTVVRCGLIAVGVALRVWALLPLS